MPHLLVHAPDAQLDGNESQLIAAFVDAVVAVYGEWAREAVAVVLVGVPPQRWGVRHDAPTIEFGIRASAFDRPDARETTERIARGIADAIGTVLGPDAARHCHLEFVARPVDRTAVGGELLG